MPTYELFHPDTEILGQVLLDLGEAVGADRFQPVLEQHDLQNLDPETWYPAQPWVDVLNEIAQLPSSMMSFVSLGMKQMERVIWPPEFHEMTFTEVLQALDEAYRMNYRGTDAGGVQAEVVSDNHVKMVIRSFEPDDLWYGNLYGLTRVLGDSELHYTVYFDEDLPRRETGGDVTVIHVEWEEIG